MYQLEISLVGDDGMDTIIDLQNWIESEHISGLHATRKDLNVDSSTLGSVEAVIIISCIAKPLLIQLSKVIETWLKERKPKLVVKLKDQENNKDIIIDATNVSNLDEHLRQLLGIIK